MSKRWVALVVLMLLLVGCTGEPEDTMVWIDIPWNGNAFPSELTHINIEGHATSPDGISQVEVWVNGTLVETIYSPPQTDGMATFGSGFSPTGAGEYHIQVVAISREGVASEPDSSVITVGEMGEDAEQPDPEEPLPAHTDTPVPPPPDDGSPVIRYWADPESITAGGCTTIYWEVTNVSAVEFGGTTQDFSGSYDDCMCETQTYPMTVTYDDGSRETFRVTIDVTGACTPPPDTTKPGPPTHLKPEANVVLPCVAAVMLRWSGPSDPSGIAEYQIQLENDSGVNNWQSMSGDLGSVISGVHAEEYELTVECGWYYRFRVRAVDGAGNVGDFFDWHYFTVTLE